MSKTTEKITVKMCEWFDDHWYKVVFPPDYDGYLPKGYKIPDGRVDWVKSVTSIQGIVRERWLESWRGEVGNEEADDILETKRDKGTAIHACTEIMDQKGKIIYNNAKRPSYSPEELADIRTKLKEQKIPYVIITDQQVALEVYRYKQLVEILRPRIVATELAVYSLDYRFGGTLDKLWYITGGKYKGIHGNVISFDEGLWMVDVKSGTQKKQKHSEQVAAYTRAYEEGKQKPEIVGGLNIYTNASQNTAGIEGLKLVQYTREEMKAAFDVFKYEIVIDKAHATQTPTILELPTVMEIE